MSSRQHIAEQQLGHIQWEPDSRGFCSCPGESLHTTKTGSRDCIVFIESNAVPTIYCLHSSCREAVATVNHSLRSAIWHLDHDGKDIPRRRRTPEEIAAAEQRQRRILRELELRHQARQDFNYVLQNFAWAGKDVDGIVDKSPTGVPADLAQHSRLMLQLFSPTDIVWIGDVKMSGQPSNSLNFRSVGEWLQNLDTLKSPMNFTCPSVFSPGSWSRSNVNVAARRFLVLESDTLTKINMLAIFKWCQQVMKLRAIVDTGGKSLHGWFVFPEPEILAELEIVLPEWGCDPALFKPSQPCRLPGVRRGEKWQRLLWLDQSGIEGQAP